MRLYLGYSYSGKTLFVNALSSQSLRDTPISLVRIDPDGYLFACWSARGYNFELDQENRLIVR